MMKPFSNSLTLESGLDGRWRFCGSRAAQYSQIVVTQVHLLIRRAFFWLRSFKIYAWCGMALTRKLECFRKYRNLSLDDLRCNRVDGVVSGDGVVLV